MIPQPKLHVLLNHQEIDETIIKLATQINNDYMDKSPIMIGILKGAFMFMADLIRHLNFSPTLDFIQVSSYGRGKESQLKIKLVHELHTPIRNRHVLLIEDIVDTGRTQAFLLDYLQHNQYDILIPVGVLSSHICSKNYEKLSSYVRVEIASYESFKIALNKNETYAFCEQHGILHPKTYSNPSDVKFPAIIKGAGEVKGKFPVKYVENAEELERELAEINKKYPKSCISISTISLMASCKLFLEARQ